jgi:hypothetical protein
MNRPQSFSKFPQLLFNFAPIHLDASVCSTPGRESQHCSSLKQGRPSAPAYLTGSMAREAQLRQQRRTPAQAQLPLLLLLASSVDGRLQGSIAAQSSLPARAPTPMRLRGGEQTREPSSTAARDGEAGGEDNSGQIGPRAADIQVEAGGVRTRAARQRRPRSAKKWTLRVSSKCKHHAMRRLDSPMSMPFLSLTSSCLVSPTQRYAVARSASS